MPRDFQELTPEQAKALILEQPAQVVDIRDPGSFELSHIQGALNLSDHNLQEFLAGADRKKPLVCYCYHGNNSRMAAQYFLSQGFESVCHIIGGYEAWQAVYPDSNP